MIALTRRRTCTIAIAPPQKTGPLIRREPRHGVNPKREALAHVRFEARNGLKLDIVSASP
jgi:hypothetical protein